jgi:hypothetical protein
MSQSWLVTVEGQPYGPYSLEQMKAFIAEGRIVAASLVAAPDAPEPHYADEDPVLGALFRPVQTAETEVVRETVKPAHGFGRLGDEDEGGINHIVIIADMKSRSINGLEEAVFNMGQAASVLPQIWLLATTSSLNAVRNTLVQKLGTLDTLFVVDATHDKAAWSNFGPESDSRMRRIWDRRNERKSA